MATAEPQARPDDVTGIVFDVQRFSLDDGPGIRTTVFLKGCPLECLWCHNPESREAQPEIGLFAEQCIGCRDCEEACPTGSQRFEEGRHVFDRTHCERCGACAEECPSGALRKLGEERSVGEVLAVVCRDVPYYERSGGGLTLSGGEPLFQVEFSRELLSGARRHEIHTCVETSGVVSREALSSVVELVDLFLFDYKATGEEAHRRLIGSGTSPVHRSLELLAEREAAVRIRCPLVPGVNDSGEHLEAIAKLGRLYPNVEGVQLLPYHRTGRHKHDRYGKTDPLPEVVPPDAEQLESWKRTLRELGCECLIG